MNIWRDERWKTAANRSHKLYKTLDRITSKMEDEALGAPNPKLEKAFDKVMSKHLPGFKYEDYLTTGGGRSTTDSLFEALEAEGIDLNKLERELSRMD